MTNSYNPGGLGSTFDYASGAGGPGGITAPGSPLNTQTPSQAFGQAPMNTQINPVTAYGGQSSTAWNQAGAYAQEGAAPGGPASAKVVNPYAPATAKTVAGVQSSQNALIGGLQQTAANGQDSAAYRQYLQSVAAGQNATRAVAASAPSGVAGAGARRGAQQQVAMQGAGAQAGGAMTAAQAQAAAQSQLGTTLGQTGQLATQNEAFNAQTAAQIAALNQKQTGINFGAQTGYQNLALGEGTTDLNALNGAAQGLAGSQGVITGEEGANFNTTQMGVAGGLSALSDVASLGGSLAGPSYAQASQASQSYNNSYGFGYEGGVNT